MSAFRLAIVGSVLMGGLVFSLSQWYATRGRLIECQQYSLDLSNKLERATSSTETWKEMYARVSRQLISSLDNGEVTGSRQLDVKRLPASASPDFRSLDKLQEQIDRDRYLNEVERANDIEERRLRNEERARLFPR